MSTNDKCGVTAELMSEPKFLKFQKSQNSRLETVSFSMEDAGCKSNHVTFGKGKVQGSQRTIDHIDTTLLARYIPTHKDLY